MANPIDSFIDSYNWLVRQPGQGVNTPNARTLAQVIRNMFKNEGQIAIQKANTALAAEKGIKPSAIPSRRPVGEVVSERRAARIAQKGVPQVELNSARLSREQRVANRMLQQGKLEKSAAVVADKPADQVIEPVVKKGRQKKEVAAPELDLPNGDTQAENTTNENPIIAPLNTAEAKAITTMSGRNAVATFGVERIAATLEKMGADHTSGSPNQMANRLIALIADK